jgi:hypothetical protein
LFVRQHPGFPDRRFAAENTSQHQREEESYGRGLIRAVINFVASLPDASVIRLVPQGRVWVAATIGLPPIARQLSRAIAPQVEK